MNDLLVIQNEFAPALLSALIHSVWTGGILYLLLRTYLDHVTGQHAAMRYQVAVVTLMTQVLLTLLLFFAIFEPGSQTRDVAETIPFEGTPAPGLAGSVGAAGKTGFPHV